MSGYVSCKCTTCFEIAIAGMDETSAFCLECEEADCDGENECQREDIFDEEEDEA